MDYGKMAYLKAEDLESRLNIKKPPASLLVAVNKALSLTPVELFEAEAGLLILLFTFQSAQNNVTLRVGSSGISQNGTGNQLTFFFNATKKSVISLSAMTSSHLIRAELISTGGGRVI